MLKLQDNNKTLYLLTLVLFLTRLPFVFSGYGSEEDAWGLILTAHNISLSGLYEVSRFPGHPVQELLLSLVWQLPAWVLNSLTALVSALGVLFFMLTLRMLKIKNVIAAGVTLAFVPVYYINSTNIMDYIWTNTLVMLAMYLVVRRNIFFAAIILGIACGFRITAGAMVLPFAVYMYLVDRKLLQAVVLGAVTTLTAIICFYPTYKTYGTAFFMYYEYFPYPPFLKNVYKATLGAWGVVGAVALAAAAAVAVGRGGGGWQGRLPEAGGRGGRGGGGGGRGSGGSSRGGWLGRLAAAIGRGGGSSWQGQLAGAAGVDSSNRRISFTAITWLCVLTIILYTYSFLKIPQKSAFVLPMVPFIILLFALLLTKKQLTRFAVAMIISSFFAGINLDNPLRGSSTSSLAYPITIGNTPVSFDLLSGPVLADYSKRKQKIYYAKTLVESFDSIKQKTLIIAGWWENEINYFSLANKNPLVTYVYYIDEKELLDYQQKKYTIYYLPEQDYNNDLRFKGTITRRFAKEW